jgi:hypothetical protein
VQGLHGCKVIGRPSVLKKAIIRANLSGRCALALVVGGLSGLVAGLVDYPWMQHQDSKLRKYLPVRWTQPAIRVDCVSASSSRVPE